MQKVTHSFVGDPQQQATLILKHMKDHQQEPLTDLASVMVLMLDSQPKQSLRQFVNFIFETTQVEVRVRNLAPETSKPNPKVQKPVLTSSIKPPGESIVDAKKAS